MATGEVMFTYDGPSAVFPELAPLTNGDATTPPHGELQVGRYAVTATYRGDANVLPSSATLSQVVERAPTRLQVTVEPNSSTFGQSVTFRAIVSPAPPSTAPLLAPTGTVTFSVDGVAAGNTQLVPRQPTAIQSRAAFTTSALLPGARAISATYSGDTSFRPSTSETTSHVVRCGTTLTGSHTVVHVPANQVTCVVEGQITGSVLAQPGARLAIDRSTVGGAIVARAPELVTLCSTQTLGAVVISEAAGGVVLGDPRNGCGGNSFGGAVVVQRSKEVTVADNSIRGALVCIGNLAVTNAGQRNTVTGARVAQCAGF